MSNDNDSFENNARSGHTPVLLNETVDLLAPADGGIYLDCTFGGGGHTSEILRRANCAVVALDRDPEARARAKVVAEKFGERFKFFSMEFSRLDEAREEMYDGVLFDFGVSSFQLDEPRRGFSIAKEARIDMRMDNNSGESALDYINKADEFDLARTLREFGEEERCKKIARAIIAARDAGKIETTADLARVVAEAAPQARGRIHPATKTFQALRIKVNDELGEIERALPKAFGRLKKGGVLAAISFHSLEDRIVKKFFKKMAGRPECRADRSCLQDRVKLASLLTNKPITASDEETRLNPRSRSAKLRAIRKD